MAPGIAALAGSPDAEIMLWGIGMKCPDLGLTYMDSRSDEFWKAPRGTDGLLLLHVVFMMATAICPGLIFGVCI
jgi:hypothetical protein